MMPVEKENVHMNLLISYVAFGILTLLWLGLGAALLFNQAILDTVWQSFRGIPLVLQIIVGFLVLPVVLGLWVWESSWPLWLRLILVLGLGFATIYTFFPKQA
jgi:hypothetical protein